MPLNVNEIFGPTIQGEGPHMGQRAYFLRLAGCPLSCYWCDTGHSWRYAGRENIPHISNRVWNKEEEVKRMSTKDIVNWLNRVADKNRSLLLVITGGEPLAQREKLLETMVYISGHFPFVRYEFETAGIIDPGGLVDEFNIHFNISPKLANSGNPYHKRYKPLILQKFMAAPSYAFKFVITPPDNFTDQYEEDWSEINSIVKEVGIPPEHVWIMPEGTDWRHHSDNLKSIAQDVIDYGYNLSARMHVQIWGDRRGV